MDQANQRFYVRAVYNDKSGRVRSSIKFGFLGEISAVLFHFPVCRDIEICENGIVTSKTQEQIKKMSTEYLVLKLSKAGLDEEVIQKMSREQLMATWAELVATGKDKPAAVAAAAVVTNIMILNWKSSVCNSK